MNELELEGVGGGVSVFESVAVTVAFCDSDRDAVPSLLADDVKAKLEEFDRWGVGVGGGVIVRVMVTLR